MKSRTLLVLGIAALAQAALLMAASGLLIYRLRDARAGLTRQQSAEAHFLRQLADTERNMYRTSILLRDYLLVTPDDLALTRRELAEVLDEMERHRITTTPEMREELRTAVSSAELTRAEFVATAKAMAAMEAADRRMVVPRFLPRQLAPLREKFGAGVKELDALVQTLRAARNRTIADSLTDLQEGAVRILSGAGLIGLLLAAAGGWRLRHYEQQLAVQLRNLEQAENDLRELSHRLVKSQENERKRISRELHDEVGQNLTALRVQLGQIETGDDESTERRSRCSELADRCLRTVRDLARGLRPAMLDDLGLGPALQWLGRDFSKSTDLDVKVEVDGDFSALDERQRTCLFRIVQEALTNCARHAGTGAARVVLHDSPEEVILTVQDRGKGFTNVQGGLGLIGMRERMEELGGELAVLSSPNAGTLIRATLPKKPEGEA